MSDTQETQTSLQRAVLSLQQGVDEILLLISDMEAAAKTAAELRTVQPLIGQLQNRIRILPPARMRESLLALAVSLLEIVQEALQRGDVNPVLLGATEDCPVPPLFAQAISEIGPEFTVSQDRMRVTLEIPQRYASIFTPDTLEQALNRQGIVFGIQPQTLQRVLQQPGTVLTVAKGEKPIPGQDAILQDVLGLRRLDGSPSILKSGRSDFKQIRLFANVAQGQVVLQKIPPTPGEPGLDVFGIPVPTVDGADIPFPDIPNTQISEDGEYLLSRVDGCIYWEKDKLKLVPALVIPANVDYSTGNINVKVAVVVNGDVLSGFRVDSLSDIIVKGTVEGAHLNAGGNVILERGVQGKDEAFIYAENNVYARFINAATVHAREGIFTEGEIMHSKIICHRLQADGEDAEILGGSIQAAVDVCAEQFGSEMGVKTLIHMGYELEKFQNEINALKDKRIEWQERIEQQSSILEYLDSTRNDQGELPAEKGKVYLNVQENLKRAQDRLIDIELALSKKENQLVQAQGYLRMVRARRNIYPGVEIRILDQKKTFQVPTGPASVFMIDAGIETSAFQERSFEGGDESV